MNEDVKREENAVADATHGLGGLKYDPAKRTRAPEWNVFGALVLIVVIFEVLNRMQGGSFLFNMRDNVDALLNQQRLDIMILQVAIIGIIALGVTQVIIIGGIDLSSGRAATPIGVSCRICPRLDCDQRAYPPSDQQIAVDLFRRGVIPYEMKT